MALEDSRAFFCLMFLEPQLFTPLQTPNSSGWIEVICGSMFSGKTEELIRRLKRAKIAQLRVEIFKPAADNRYHDEDIVSHNQNSIRSTPVLSASEILLLSGDCDVIGLDEVQFFDDTIIEVCNNLANQGKRIIIAGLDMDFKGEPFGPMPKLMAIAEHVTKVHAVCVQCGGAAQYSYRTVSNQSTVLLGESESYEARCRACFHKE